MGLPYDKHRCMGAECAIREGCARYVWRGECGPATPAIDNASGREILLPEECEFHIPEGGSRVLWWFSGRAFTMRWLKPYNFLPGVKHDAKT